MAACSGNRDKHSGSRRMPKFFWKHTNIFQRVLHKSQTAASRHGVLVVFAKLLDLHSPQCGRLRWKMRQSAAHGFPSSVFEPGATSPLQNCSRFRFKLKTNGANMHVESCVILRLSGSKYNKTILYIQFFTGLSLPCAFCFTLQRPASTCLALYQTQAAAQSGCHWSSMWG